MPTFAELLSGSDEHKKKQQEEIAKSPTAQKANEHMLPPEQTLNNKPSVTKEGKYHDAVADFITGKSDTQPTSDDFEIKFHDKPQTKPVDFNRLLHGTGITKRLGEQTAKQLDRATQVETKTDKAVEVSTAIPAIKDLKAPDDIDWDPYQLAALEGLSKQKYGCLIGAAGTGKTTVTKELVNRLYDSVPQIDLNRTRVDKEQSKEKETNVAICFCAFTGRAVQQMKRALPIKFHPLCNTVHKTLGYMPEKEDYYDEEKKEYRTKTVFRPTFTADNQLPYKICIVDESGMLPINLWNELFAALPDDCRIILIGDINQLPPVQGRSVLGFAMINWPTYTLEHIHRQAADNPIIANAHNILHGMLPKEDKKRFATKILNGGSVPAAEEIIKSIVYLNQKDIFDPFRDALIVPKNVDTLGQVHLNERLVQYFNPEKTDEDGICLNKRYVITAGYTHHTFAVGDKVMLLQNDNQKQLTNGMTGVVVSIAPNGNFQDEKGNAQLNVENIDIDNAELDLNFDSMSSDIGDIEVNKDDEEKESQRAASHIMTVKFGVVDGDREVTFSTAGQFRKVAHAYAFTCHKSQGGEYPTVVIVCHSADLRMLNREWLYTAVTRAQQRVILLYNNRGLIHAVNNQTIKGKSVKEKAEKFLALQGKDDTQLPDLPMPQEI